jgi:ribose transport system ATP-binding protein
VSDGSTALLSCRNVGVAFDGVPALTGVDFDLQPGEVHGLVGCNGAGKSTLMKVLAGVVPHYTGEVRLDGRPVRLDSPRTALARGVAMVYQELSGIGQLSVAENLFLGRKPITRLGRVDWSRMRREGAAALAELDLQVDLNQPLGELPLVIRQMVEIARGLGSGARVLILDEPTSALSLPEARRLFDLMRKLKARGVAMVFISHFIEDVLAICDRVTILRDGRKLTTQPVATLQRASVIEQMVGSETAASGQDQLEARLPPLSKTPIRLRIDGFSRGATFQEVSFRVHQGECLGLYGFVGAGHQELLHALAGATIREAGEVRIDNKPVVIRSVADAVQQGLVLVAADRAQTVVRGAPIAHNVTLAHLPRVLGNWITRKKEAAICQPLLERVSRGGTSRRWSSPNGCWGRLPSYYWKNRRGAWMCTQKPK